MSIYAIAAAIAGVGIKVWTVLNRALDSSPLVCRHQYTTEVLSTDPLMIYINNFVSPEEIDLLLDFKHNFTYPTVLHPDRKSNSHRRTSSYIVIPGEAEDNTASCVRERAESFLGFIPNVGLEELQIGRTQQGEHHALHWDYLLDPKPDDSGVVCNRAASFFVFLSNVEEGGETYFPFLEPPAGSNMDEKKFLRPVGEDSLGLMVRPVKGNAIFWMNMYSNGTLDERSMHAGMQVINGTKYGMNILAERCI